MNLYYGPDGGPLAMLEWCELREKRGDDMSPESWWRKHTRIDDEVTVSTVWLGLDHQWGLGPPLFWETMIFGGEHSDGLWRYSSRQEAFDDHERIIRALRAGADPEEAS